MDLFRLIRDKKIKDFITNFSQEDLNIINESSYNLLMVSIFEELKEISLFLIDKGIDLNYQDKKGQTILHHIAIYFDKEILETSLKKNIDINLVDIYGNQALWSAVFNDKGYGKRALMVSLLLSHGANPNHINNVNKSPLQIAELAGYKEVFELMINN
ncbi:ankyrin repeat domain-containing protein [Aquimarina sp. Aq78]|uniref:ankyrin repeat domain-containing protein n=1 Tax=Aquimarina sp. Aq78 TaxID=1191889 RepID=UPI000D0FB131|nr:ankyrin repeat domain-containing protein [Aquimarina sp. Aq78]